MTRLLGAGLTIYLLIVLAMFFAQRWLMYPASTAVPELPQGYEKIAIRTNDGLQLAAAYRKAAGGMPTIVFFHGNGSNWSSGSVATSLLAQEDLGVLLASYRGYSGNPGKPSETGLYADGKAALQWLAGQGVTSDRVILVGNSLGSGVATQLALEDRPAALILVSPFSGMAEVAAESYPWLPVRWLVLDRFDNLAKIGKVAAPKLILHGRADTLVPVHQAERLASAAKGTELILFDGIGHDLVYRPVAQEAQSAWLKATGLIAAR